MFTSFRQKDSSFYKKQFFLFFSFLMIQFAFIPKQAEAHSYSASYSQITMNKDKTEIVFSLDTLSIFELLPKIDTNKDWILQNSELKKGQHHLKELITEGLTLDRNNHEQAPNVEKIKIVKKSNKEFLSVYLRFPAFSPGDTIVFNDGFYYHDTTANYVNLISANIMGETSEAVLQGDNRTWTILITEAQQEQGSSDNQTDHPQQTPKQTKTMNTTSTATSSTWFSFFKLGMLHILTGYDHLLFLFALLLRKQTWKQYAAIVTSFTIAHSITLSLAVLGVVTLPSRFVESVIAFSICYVALENIFRKEINHRWTLTFLFGLIHGLGFASILREMAIPKSHLAVALVNFNLGIEAIQLTIVLVLLPILAFIQKQKKYSIYVKVGSIIITLLGGFWLVERIFF
ncbi:HupE/UreJ family protein [Bacillus sp. JJ1764]|uniref:HupE/UreJ family protein n=1 Tax=Bacillus sp. JJ1764 TaxID=3122964 RepID=UPI002FFEE93E